MKLYLIENTTSEEFNSRDIETYLSAVVVASSPEAAKRIHPGLDKDHFTKDHKDLKRINWPVNPDLINVFYIGEAKIGLLEGDVICSDYDTIPYLY